MQTINQNRRQFIGSAAMTLAALPLTTWPSTATPSTKGKEPPIAASPVHRGSDTPGTAQLTGAPSSTRTFDQIKQINAGLLNIGYAEAGPAYGPVVLLLQGWPYDIHSYADVAPLLADKGYRVIMPYVRGCGTTRFLSSETFLNGEPAAAAQDVIDLIGCAEDRKGDLRRF